MKIVETNILYSDKGLEDHQSRILEVSSWEEYCDLFIKYDGNSNGERYKCVYHPMIGCVMPKNASITDLKIDDYHLTCHIKLWNGFPEYKLAYVVEK